jgi:hypothetical protein
VVTVYRPIPADRTLRDNRHDHDLPSGLEEALSVIT